MNVKKTLSTVVVWYDANTGKVSLAKDRKTGKFINLAIAQGLLNVEMNSFHVPSTPIAKVDYSFLVMLGLLVCLTVLVGLPVGLIAAKIAGYDSVVVENIALLRAAFVAWFLSVIIIASAGNK